MSLKDIKQPADISKIKDLQQECSCSMNPEEQPLEEPPSIGISDITKFSSLSWFFHRQKARLVAVAIWCIIGIMIYLSVRSFANDTCRYKKSKAGAYGGVAFFLIVIYFRCINKHIRAPFKSVSYRDNFNGVGSVYQQMNIISANANAQLESETQEEQARQADIDLVEIIKNKKLTREQQLELGRSIDNSVIKEIYTTRANDIQTDYVKPIYYPMPPPRRAMYPPNISPRQSMYSTNPDDDFTF